MKKNFDSYALYISRVLKSVFPDIGITLPSISIMDSFVKDLFERIASEAQNLARNYGKTTISVKEIETATKLILKSSRVTPSSPAWKSFTLETAKPIATAPYFSSYTL